MGAALAYYFIFPMAWKFFLSFQTSGGADGLQIELQAKVSEYLTLVMKLIMAFGIAFELPVALTLLAMVGIVTSEQLRKFRRYAIVGAFVAAAILTPPDVIDPAGQAFDANHHQAMAEQPSPEHETGTVIQAWTPTWTLHGRLLKPAMVVVAKN